MEFFYSRSFRRQFKKLPAPVRQAVRARMTLFSTNEFHSLLNNHPLAGEWEGYRSINITGNYRLIFKKETETLVRVEAVGTHPQLYG